MKFQKLFRQAENSVSRHSIPTLADLERTVREQAVERRSLKTPSQKLHVQPRDRWAVSFAGFQFGESYEGNHGCIGSIGSGKTLLLDPFIRDAAYVCYSGSGNLLVVWDTKGTVPQMLRGEGIPYTALSLSVKDAASWNIAADCEHDPVLIGATLYPLVKQDEKTPFWSNSQRSVITSTARGLDTIGKLTISNLYRVSAARLELLSELFAKHPSNALFQSLLWNNADDKLKGNILAGVATSLEPFAIAAAHDHYAKKKVSLKKEIAEGGVLVIQMDMATISMTLPFYQMLLNRLINLLSSLPDKRDGSTFIVLDELPIWRRIDELPNLLAFGRSKRCHVAYSVQQVKQLDTFYAPGEVGAILANTDHIVFLRSNDPDTEELLSRKFGEQITPQVSYSSNYSRTVEYVAKPRLMPGALGRLKAPSPDDGIYFYMDSRYFSSPIPAPFRLPGDWVEKTRPKVDRSVSGLIRKPGWMNIVPPLTESEAQELLHGLPPAEIEIEVPEPKNEFEKVLLEEMERYFAQLADQIVVSFKGVSIE